MGGADTAFLYARNADRDSKLKSGRLDYQDTYLVVPPAVEAGYDRFRIYEMSIQGDSHAVAYPEMIEIVDRYPVIT